MVKLTRKGLHALGSRDHKKESIWYRFCYRLSCIKDFINGTFNTPFAMAAIASAWAGQLTIQRHADPSYVTLNAEALPEGRNHAFWFSEDMQHWYPAASAQGSSLEYLDQGGVDERFFALRSQLPAEVELSEDWKDQITLDEDPFWVSFKATDQDPFLGPPTDQKETAWIKFSILMEDLSRVYFQNGKALPFHYDFGTRYLPRLKDLLSGVRCWDALLVGAKSDFG